MGIIGNVKLKQTVCHQCLFKKLIMCICSQIFADYLAYILCNRHIFSIEYLLRKVSIKIEKIILKLLFRLIYAYIF